MSNPPADPEPGSSSRGWLQALGAGALAFMFVMMVTSDLCAGGESRFVGQDAQPFAGVVVAGAGAVDGDRITLESLRGRVVVVDFWASWCPPCRASVPALEAFSRAHPDVVVLGVNVEGNRNASFVRGAHAQLGATYPTLHDADGSIQTSYGITGLPTLLVIDPTGRITASHVGVVDGRWLERHATAN